MFKTGDIIRYVSSPPSGNLHSTMYYVSDRVSDYQTTIQLLHNNVCAVNNFNDSFLKENFVLCTSILRESDA